jgi:hypothetical protein
VVAPFQNAVRGIGKQDCSFDRRRSIIEPMPSSTNASETAPEVSADLLRHVRWLAGGTGSGKSTIAAGLARRFDLDVYRGDRAEHDWLTRCSPQHHPHLAAARKQRPGDNWRGRSPEQAFEAMAGRHGETVDFLVEDLLARRNDRVIVVDYFGVLPRDLAPLLSWPGQAAFLIPTPSFRRSALSQRYADQDRARVNWGDLDPAEVLETRLARDALWDSDVIAQATSFDLALISIDGARSVEDLATELAERFVLRPAR